MEPAVKAEKCSDPAPAWQDAPDTAALLARLGRCAHPAGSRPVAGLYLHIPFCFHKCHYCDFYSLVDTQDRQEAFVRRMIGEIDVVAPLVQGPIRTIFVGGGTPTLLQAPLWRPLLEAMRSRFDLSKLREFTVEANPETVAPDLLETLAAGGVNRMSVGAQSFNAAHLKTLERWHDPRKVGESIGLIRAAGIQNVNLDLIFAIPGQTEEDWLDDLRTALELEPTHLSCYSLMFEPNTPLTQKLKKGMIQRADESAEAGMYQAAIERLAGAGFAHYEISNWAKPGREAEHNLLYWRNEHWLAIGPGGSGHVDGVRWKNVPHLGRYLAGGGAGGSPIQEVERLDADGSLGEQLMLRLRLIEGVERDWLAARIDDRRRAVIEEKVAMGLLEWTPERVRLTRRGLMIADSIFADLL